MAVARPPRPAPQLDVPHRTAPSFSLRNVSAGTPPPCPVSAAAFAHRRCGPAPSPRLGADVPPARGKERHRRPFSAEATSVTSDIHGAGASTVEAAKLRILSLVAGLDRGVAASPSDTGRVLGAVEALEREASLRTFQEAAGALEEEAPQRAFGLEAMGGLWRLVFSSGFAAGSLGGLRPGPPTGRLPILVGQVLQRIDLSGRHLDNIVELRVGVLPWPLPALEVTAALGHSLEVLGTATFRITYDKTTVTAGTFDAPNPLLPPLSTPELPEFLRGSAPVRSGQFETTYLDEDFRVSRGDLGELRVFVKA